MGHPRSNEVLPAPANPRHRLVHVGFASPGGRDFNHDKDRHGHRYDSVGICNGVVHAGASCVRYQYDPSDPARCERELAEFDAYILRVNPGQLSNPGVPDGAQDAFDAIFLRFAREGKPVWSSPTVQKAMGAKDALVRIANLSCGLPDTRSYYTPEAFAEGFRVTAAFQPRVVKQNRGSAGEGIWACWLKDKPYCRTFGEARLELTDTLELMEMCDNHVERHTVGEFIEFCVNGSGSPGAGRWRSARGGGYLPGRSSGAHVVDQRLLPRVKEGEVRMLMVRDALFQIIHKKPRDGGLSAVGTLNESTFYEPECDAFAALREKFLGEDLPELLKVLGLDGEPLPLIWTADFIPCDDPRAEDNTRWVVGEFNCSCVGVSRFLNACGEARCIENVSDEDYAEGMRLCDKIGEMAVKKLDELQEERANARARGGGAERERDV